jgi:hypothetical protein
VIRVRNRNRRKLDNQKKGGAEIQFTHAASVARMLKRQEKQD